MVRLHEQIKDSNIFKLDIPVPFNFTEVIEELSQMQKSISQETSALGPISQYSSDILDEALAISTPVAGTDVKEAASMPHFTPQQMESLFWALVNVSGLKSPSFSATKIGELYLNACASKFEPYFQPF